MERSLMPIGELAEVMRDFGASLCQPKLEIDDCAVKLTVEFPLVHLHAVELSERLRHVVDMHQLRAIAAQYDIDPVALEALLNSRRTDGA